MREKIIIILCFLLFSYSEIILSSFHFAFTSSFIKLSEIWIFTGGDVLANKTKEPQTLFVANKSLLSGIIIRLLE